MSDEVLRDLAQRAGVEVEWQDTAGGRHVVAPEVLRHVLAALRLPADNTRDLAASRRLLMRRGSLADLPPLLTALAGRPTRLELGGNEPQAAELVLERGGQRALSLLPARGRLRIPAIPEIGYHRLQVGERELVLAVAPPRCRAIEDIVPDPRLWGIAAQLHGLGRAGDGGIGDLAGVAELARSAGAKGADAILLSPMHALYAAEPNGFGGDAPSSRLFLNPLHAAPELVFGGDAEPAAASSDGLSDRAAAKYAGLRNRFYSFLDSDEWHGALGADFARFRADGGQWLLQHACFETLQAGHMAQRNWRAWPVDLRDPGGVAVACFADAHQDEILFHQFLQWLADRSVAAAQDTARQAGMRIGLIGDLVMGMDPAGSQAWSRQAEILLGLTVGAPPDPANLDGANAGGANAGGRNRGLTGFSPRALQDGGFVSFLATVRAAMRHDGGIRIDPGVGLARLWVMPEGASPAEGAWLNFPVTDLLRLLALESVRHDVVVIGAAAPTEPEGFQETLAQNGIHGMRVLWRERDAETGFVPSRGWGSADVAMTSTPDLPTVAGWWRGDDIEAGKGDGVDEAAGRRQREQDRPKLWRTFVREHVAEEPAPDAEDTERVVDAAVRFVAKTEVPLSIIPLEDLLGRQQPLSGAIDGNPGGRLPVGSDAVLDHEAVARRIHLVAAERPRQ